MAGRCAACVPRPLTVGLAVWRNAMTDRKITISCRTCGKKLDYGRRGENPFFPFCSERCKLIDLGKWLSEEHRIVEPASDASDVAGQDEGKPGREL